MRRPDVVISVVRGHAFVQGCHPGLRVEIRDYDVTEDGPNVRTDEAGDRYVVVNP